MQYNFVKKFGSLVWVFYLCFLIKKIAKMTSEKQQEAIDEIMDNFDFDKVFRVMKFLEWGWMDYGVPSVSDLRGTARVLLKECIKSKSDVSTGGLCAYYYEFDGIGVILKLKFVVEEWDWDEGLDGIKD